jgi:fluoride exporter
MIILIGLGGSFGALLRYLIGVKMPRKSTAVFPFATFLINSTGSLLLGIVGALFSMDLLSEWAWYFVGVGFMGAYTTFSTFGVEAVQLFIEGNGKLACYYVLLSVLTGIAVAGFGFITTTFFL